jgi:hypothetical protein
MIWVSPYEPTPRLVLGRLSRVENFWRGHLPSLPPTAILLLPPSISVAHTLRGGRCMLVAARCRSINGKLLRTTTTVNGTATGAVLRVGGARTYYARGRVRPKCYAILRTFSSTSVTPGSAPAREGERVSVGEGEKDQAHSKDRNRSTEGMYLISELFL